MNTSDLRTLLRDDFGQDFPISGGNGESCEAAIVIHRQRPNNYVAVEYGVLDCLAIRRGVEWQPLLQATAEHLTVDHYAIKVPRGRGGVLAIPPEVCRGERRCTGAGRDPR